MTTQLGAARRAGIPPFHVMDVWAAAGERQRTHGDLVNLSAGQPSTPAPAPVRAAAAKALESEVLGYTVALGIPPLRAAIAAHYGRTYDLDVAPEQVVVTTGSSGGFLLAFLAAFDVGDRVAMARPGYPCYRNILTALGCEVVELPCGAETRYQPTVAMLEALDEPVKGLVRRQPGQPDRHRARPGRAGRARHLVRRPRRAAGQRRDLPRHRLRGRPRPDVRVGDVARGDRRQLVLQVLLDDRLAAGLAGAAAPAAARRRLPRGQLHRLPARAAAGGRAWPRSTPRATRRRTGTSPATRSTATCCSTASPASASPASRRPTAPSTSTPTSRTSPTTRWTWCTGCSPTWGWPSRPGLDFDPALGHRFIRLSFAGSEGEIREALVRLERWLG